MQIIEARHRGFTLIELLVVIAIIAVLDRLAPAGGPSGARGRPPAQCTNNLKQIGIAMHSYHDQMGSYPPGEITAHHPANGPNGWGPRSTQLAWRAMILPQMEGTTSTTRSISTSARTRSTTSSGAVHGVQHRVHDLALPVGRDQRERPAAQQHPRWPVVRSAHRPLDGHDGRDDAGLQLCRQLR